MLEWGRENVPPELAPRIARKLAERLGATYVKLGQFVASMNHVLPPQYPETLARCQDRATPVKFETVKQAVEAELRLAALADAFSHFEPEPIAAASLAQVHRAVLATGEEVVVKVQRENLLDLFHVDLWNRACTGVEPAPLAPPSLNPSFKAPTS